MVININKIINKLLSLNLIRTYTVIKTNDGFKLVKVLNIYEKHTDASDDMIDVVTNQKNELELLMAYNKKCGRS